MGVKGLTTIITLQNRRPVYVIKLNSSNASWVQNLIHIFCPGMNCNHDCAFGLVDEAVRWEGR